MKLGVGMYVRTQNVPKKINEINKISAIEYEKVFTKILLSNGLVIYPEEISKTSFNIIDIMEEGDYVNGYKVSKVKNEIKGFGVIVFDDNTSIHEYNINSVVTKEQFKSMQYNI